MEEVVGYKLKIDVPALTPLRAELLEGLKKENEDMKKTNKVVSMVSGGILKIKIAEGKGIDIEVPLNITSASPMLECNNIAGTKVKEDTTTNLGNETEVKPKEKLVRKVIRKYFKIDEVKFGEETKIEGTTLYIRKNICDDAIKASPLVKDIKIDIITQDKYNTYSETIMDVQPIATKEGDSKIGSGVTRVLDGVIIMVTGTDEKGVQIGEFGSSEGILEQNIQFGRPGAMHDNLILPIEPVGVIGAKPNVDLGNIPVMLSPLEVLDGGIHALICIGPASKECSRHYWREPLVIEAMNDPELDLCGVLVPLPYEYIAKV